MGFQVDSMQFYADLLNVILGESAPSSKNLHLEQNAIEWPRMIVTNARDVYDKLSTEKGWTPATEGADIGDCHHSRMAGQKKHSGTLDRGRKYDHERSDERSRGVKTAPGSSAPERRMECTKRRHIGSREISASIEAYTNDEN